MIFLKEHTKDGRKLVAICDKALLGRTLREKDVLLDLGSSFYAGRPADPAKLPNILRSCLCINAVGRESVGLLVAEGLVEEGSVKKAEGVPFVQVYFL
ncbi:MAG: DUF424 family protein [DPANN group archaeon]|nr:DUF424 family protein [DPANN group archaeon]